jgi:flagellar biosynthetic protein FliQ
MQPQDAIDLVREALFTALLLSAPVLGVGLLVALLIGVLQALTQVQDQTISFVPKIVVMLAALAVLLPWLVERMVDYSRLLITHIPVSITGG